MNTIPSAIEMAKNLVKNMPSVFPNPELASALIAGAMLEFYTKCQQSLEPDFELNTVGVDISKIDEP